MKLATDQIRGRKSSTTRRSLVWFNWHIALRNAFITVCSSSSLIFVAFALSTGIPGEHMARFTAAAGLGCIFQVLVLPMLQIVSDRKRFTLWVCIVEALMFFAMIAAVFFSPHAAREYVLLAGIFLATSMMNMTQPIRDDWLGATIPSSIRGSFLGHRDMLSCLSMAGATLFAGVSGDLVGKHNTPGLSLILVVAAVFGILSVAALARVQMPRATAVSRIHWSAVRQILAEPPFRRYIAAMFTFNVPFFLAIPYYQVLNQKALNMNLRTIGMMATSYMLIRAVASRFAGAPAGRMGARSVLLIMGPAYAAFFASLTLTQPARIWPVILGWTCVSVVDAFESIAMQANLFGAVPENGPRPAFFAITNLIVLSATAIGATISEIIVHLFRNISIHWGPFAMGQYQCLYAICAILMVPCTFGALFLKPRSGAAVTGT
jgi:MFS family permease